MLKLFFFFILLSPTLFAAEGLKAFVTNFLNADSFQKTKISFTILNQKGEEQFSFNPDKKLNQASVSKIIISFAAIKKLGLNYRFKTVFYTVGKILSDGTLEGDLIVKGFGDPNITTEELHKMVDYFRLIGLKKIKGNIVFDFSYFDRKYNIYDFKYEDDSRSYAALNSALPLNFNAVQFSIRPGENSGDPGRIVIGGPVKRMVQVKNRLKTVDKRRSRIRIKTRVGTWGRTRLEIKGRINPKRPIRLYYRKLFQPDRVFSRTFTRMLKWGGIKLTGKIKHNYRKDYIKKRRGKYLHTHYTRYLFDLITVMNRYSNNFMAEQLLKIIGAEANEGYRGSWASGIKVVQEILEGDIKFKRGSYQYHNASGLNDANFFSSRQIARLMYHIHSNFDYKWYLLAALPKMGLTGTLKRYCLNENCNGALIAKTGSLRTTIALAGIMKGKDQIFSFSFVVNFERSRKIFKAALTATKTLFTELIHSGVL